MPPKKDESLRNFVKESVSIIVGKQAELIVDFLDGSKYINEFLIAKKLDITINQTRNILYKLSDQGIVSSIRKKDKRKGWYTYFWKMEIIKALEFLKDYIQKRNEQIKHQIESRELKRFYICERCNIEFNEENALLHEFTCNECGSVFVLKDNTKVLRELKKNYAKYSNDLKEIDGELDLEKEKLEKKKTKEVQKEEKEKKKKREEKKVATQKAKKEAEKTSPKKVKKTSAEKVKKISSKKVKPSKKKVSLYKKTLKKSVKKK
jgi:transcription factor E